MLRACSLLCCPKVAKKYITAALNINNMVRDLALAMADIPHLAPYSMSYIFAIFKVSTMLTVTKIM